MAALIYLTGCTPDPLAQQLMRVGHSVWESHSVSEVLHLCENHEVQAVVIADGVEHYGLDEIAQHHVTLQLRPNATALDVIWELAHLLAPSKSIQ